MVRIWSKSCSKYPLVVVSLGILNTILLLSAVVLGIYCAKIFEEPGVLHVSPQMMISEVKQLQIKLNKAVKAQEEAQQGLQKAQRNYQQLVVDLETNKTLTDKLQKEIETLNTKRTALREEKDNLEESCGRCPPAWFSGNGSCYFYAKHPSHPKKNWTESREDCISRGGDLAIIDNWEEQANIFEHIPRVDERFSVFWDHGGVWIGLNDIQTEGSWVWVDNKTLQGDGYWADGEPNNNGYHGEDCGLISTYVGDSNPMLAWRDRICKSPREWLCEKKMTHL